MAEMHIDLDDFMQLGEKLQEECGKRMELVKVASEMAKRIAILERELDHWSSGEWREVLDREECS